MLISERFEKILQVVNQKGSARLGELAELLGSSESTIRRDVYALHEMGKLQKVHGGATSLEKNYLSRENTLFERFEMMKSQKELIAKTAAKLVRDGETIFLDAGTTTGYMVAHLSASNLLVVTNSLIHAQNLVRKGIRTIVLGGEIRPISEAIEGIFAAELLERFNFDKAFLGTNGFSHRSGHTTPSPYEAQVKETARKGSHQTFVLADHTKQNIVTLTSFAKLEDTTLITDSLDEEYEFIPHIIAKEETL